MTCQHNTDKESVLFKTRLRQGQIGNCTGRDIYLVKTPKYPIFNLLSLSKFLARLLLLLSTLHRHSPSSHHHKPTKTYSSQRLSLCMVLPRSRNKYKLYLSLFFHSIPTRDEIMRLGFC
jgi:hypothetical protein